METNQKRKQTANNKSNKSNKDGQKNQAIQKEKDTTSQKDPSSDDNEPTSTEKERKSGNHEHYSKTPVAEPDGEKGNQSEKAEQDTKENQSSK